MYVAGWRIFMEKTLRSSTILIQNINCIIMLFMYTFSSNVLLDENFAGKLSDFSFSAQNVRRKDTKAGLAGTNGYRPLEYSYS